MRPQREKTRFYTMCLVFAFELKGVDLVMHFAICPILLTKDRKGSKKGFYELIVTETGTCKIALLQTLMFKLISVAQQVI